MCNTPYKPEHRGVDAAHELANMLAMHFDKPVDYLKLQSFILANWERLTVLAHRIHDDDRRSGKDRRA